MSATTAHSRTMIGVDAGGTSTRAVVLDETGQCLALARTGPGNPTSAGPELAIVNVTAACVQAMEAAPPATPAPTLVVFSMAGVLAAGGRLPGVDEAMAAVGFGADTIFKGDVLSAYFSATDQPDGSVLIVGTGTTGAQVADGELAGVRDGLGWLLGDEGSGFWIGQRVVQAVCRELDGRGPETALTPLLLDLVDVSSDLRLPFRDSRLIDLQAWAYARRPVELSVAGSLIGQVADDPVAADIIDQAALRLLATAASVVAETPDRPLVLGGSVAGEGSVVGQRLVELLAEHLPAQLLLRARDGVAGSALMALRALGAPADAEALARINGSLAALR